MALLWPIIFLADAADALGWAHFIGRSSCCWAHFGPLCFRQMLPMASPGPIYFSGGTSDALGWAHCNSSSCCQNLCFGPLSLWQLLPITSDVPIRLATAALLHGATLAHECSS